MQFGWGDQCKQVVMVSKNAIIHERITMREDHQSAGIMLYSQDDHNLIKQLMPNLYINNTKIQYNSINCMISIGNLLIATVFNVIAF